MSSVSVNGLSVKGSHAPPPQIQLGIVPPRQPNPLGGLTFGGGCAAQVPVLRIMA
jgi:hypothetical protein